MSALDDFLTKVVSDCVNGGSGDPIYPLDERTDPVVAANLATVLAPYDDEKADR